MLVSILLMGFIILGLFLSMVSSYPKPALDDAVTFLPHPGENVPQAETAQALSPSDYLELNTVS
jgi:hypothetical protein